MAFTTVELVFILIDLIIRIISIISWIKNKNPEDQNKKSTIRKKIKLNSNKNSCKQFPRKAKIVVNLKKFENINKVVNQKEVANNLPKKYEARLVSGKEFFDIMKLQSTKQSPLISPLINPPNQFYQKESLQKVVSNQQVENKQNKMNDDDDDDEKNNEERRRKNDSTFHHPKIYFYKNIIRENEEQKLIVNLPFTTNSFGFWNGK